MSQLQLFQEYKNDQELHDELSAWYDVEMENEREQDEELQIWFDVMMALEAEEQAQFEEEMFRYMDCVLEGQVI